jgi:hypothetical protein
MKKQYEYWINEYLEYGMKEERERRKRINGVMNMVENITEYFERLTKFTAISEQKNILNTFMDEAKKDVIVSCGRGIGKSLLASLYALYLASEVSTKENPITVMLVSHQQEIYVKTDLFFRNDPRLVERLRTKGTHYCMPQEEYEFSDTCGRVILRLDTSRQVRGNDVNIVICDETQSIPSDIITQDVRPCAKKYPHKIVLLGTPSESGYFVETLEKINKKRSKEHSLWYMLNYPSTVCWWLKDAIERAKNDLPSDQFESEYMAKVPNEDIISPFRKYRRKYISDTSPDAEKVMYSYTVMGIDLGEGGANKYGITVIEKNKKNKRLRTIYTEEWYDRESTQHILELLQSFHPLQVMIDSQPKREADRVKTEVEFVYKKYHKDLLTNESIPNCEFIYINATGIKNSMINNLVELMKTGNVIISEQLKDLIKELDHYSKSKNRNKNLADALILAAYSNSKPLVAKERPNVVVFTKDKIDLPY